MDYLDPKKRFRHQIMLLVGYVLIGIAIVIGTLVLLYQAYGFGLGKNGTVIQNGLFFFSSQPHPAAIYMNGVKQSVQTNTRLSMPADVYRVDIKRDGYIDWQRTISLEGGSVQHVDYPFLFPRKLAPKPTQSYSGAPGLITQSPDRRWLLIQQPNAFTRFNVFDLKNPEKPSLPIELPANVLTKASGAESWQFDEWADDNNHVLLQHIYDGKFEYILLNRSHPEESVNVTNTLALNPTKLTLQDKKYDKYYAYDAATLDLQTVSLKDPTPQPYLKRVLSYQPYGESTMLYATDDAAPGKVAVKLRTGDKTMSIRSFIGGSNYLVDLTEYSGKMYVAAGSGADNKVYVYKDPVSQIKDFSHSALPPEQILRVKNPNYLSFSDSAQFIMIENGAEFGVYDIENELAYHYTAPFGLDAPQTHAAWMDGNRLTYASHGKQVVFDYDNANQRVLVSAAGAYKAAFTPNYKFIYTLAPAANPAGQFDLYRTSLLTPPDQ